MTVARQVFVLLSVLLVSWGLERCEASGKFSLDVHHVMSDAVKQSLGFDNLMPEKESLEYFKVLAHRDRFIRGRGLASNNEETPITSENGNLTIAINFLGYLHYANVSVGTPATWFLVALDSSADLFWLPCNCGTSCIRDLDEAGLKMSLPLNLYSPNASSTSSNIRCSDKRCFGPRKCSSHPSICPYQLSRTLTTATRGRLLQDVLHLVTEDVNLKPVEAKVTLGCGQNQTGLFQKDVAVNGVLGLGMKDYSVPSILAKANITANSFSMCFGRVISALGRISFGDKGYSDQEETPFIAIGPSKAYGVNVTEVSVSGDPLGVRFFAQFDTGSSFTRLLEPAYGLFTQALDDQVKDKRRPVDPEFPFDFCYDLSPNVTTWEVPPVEMTFAEGSNMSLQTPFFGVQTQEGNMLYCMGILTSKDLKINIIGQNLMSGHRIVFDRERMILGWKRSYCFDDESLPFTAPPPPEAPSSPVIKAPPPSLPPVAAATPPPVNTNSAENPGSVGASILILLLLPVLSFL